MRTVFACVLSLTMMSGMACSSSSDDSGVEAVRIESALSDCYLEPAFQWCFQVDFDTAWEACLAECNGEGYTAAADYTAQCNGGFGCFCMIPPPRCGCGRDDDCYQPCGGPGQCQDGFCQCS